MRRKHRWGEKENRFEIIDISELVKLPFSPDLLNMVLVGEFWSKLGVKIEEHDGKLGFWATTVSCERCEKIHWIKEDLSKLLMEDLISASKN